MLAFRTVTYCTENEETPEWDADASVWVATSDDVPGLVTESDTLEALQSKVQIMVPELLEANGCLPANKIIQIELLMR